MPQPNCRRAVSAALAASVLLAVGAALCGCYGQRVTVREFYEPTSETLTRRDDGLAVGAVKSETIKSGSRDEGDRDYTIGLINLNER